MQRIQRHQSLTTADLFSFFFFNGRRPVFYRVFPFFFQWNASFANWSNRPRFNAKTRRPFNHSTRTSPTRIPGSACIFFSLFCIPRYGLKSKTSPRKRIRKYVMQRICRPSRFKLEFTAIWLVATSNILKMGTACSTPQALLEVLAQTLTVKSWLWLSRVKVWLVDWSAGLNIKIIPNAACTNLEDRCDILTLRKGLM